MRLAANQAKARLDMGLAALLLLALAVVGASWAVASHPGSSPDDDFHLNSTWCAWGREATGCEIIGRSAGNLQVSVPALEDAISSCNWFEPTVSASCIQESGGTKPARPISNDGSYPPGYYGAARILVGSDTERSIIVIRLVSFLISSCLIVASGLILTRQERWRSWWFIAVLSVPLGWFIFASTNPSGPSIAGAAAVCAASYSIGCRPGRHLPALALGVTGGLIASLSRADGWQFAAAALALGAVASFRSVSVWGKPRAFLQWAVVLLPLILVWQLSGRPPSQGYSASSVEGAAAQTPSVFGNLLEIPQLMIGPMATKLGQFGAPDDTPMPSIVWGCIALSIGGLLAIGLVDLTWGRIVAILGAAALLVMIPLWMLNAVGQTVGYWVQPRYLLPLVMSLGVLLAVRPRGASPPPVGPVVIVSLLAVTAHTWALHQTIRRSVTGLDVQAVSLSPGAEWWWQTSVGPNMIWLIGSGTFAFLVAGLSWRVLRNGPDVEVRAEADRPDGAVRADSGH